MKKPKNKLNNRTKKLKREDKKLSITLNL